MRHSTFDLVVEFSESNVQGKVHNVTETDVGKTIFCSIILLHLQLCFPLIKLRACPRLACVLLC